MNTISPQPTYLERLYALYVLPVRKQKKAERTQFPQPNSAQVLISKALTNVESALKNGKTNPIKAI